MRKKKIEIKPLDKPISDSLINEIENLLIHYRDEEMPDWNEAFHYNAEGWASMKSFMEWLKYKNNELK